MQNVYLQASDIERQQFPSFYNQVLFSSDEMTSWFSIDERNDKQELVIDRQ